MKTTKNPPALLDDELPEGVYHEDQDKDSENPTDNQINNHQYIDVIEMIKNGVGVVDPGKEASKARTGEANYFVSGTDLLNRKVEDIPTLVDPLLPRSGVGAMGGASDTGKSSLLRQLAISNCTGEDFLGFPVNSRYNRSIYVSTEDDEIAISYLMNKQNKDLRKHPDEMGELMFLFETENLIEKLDFSLSDKPADLVVVDCFTDIYGRSMNQANEVRTFLNQFSQLANKHECLFMFLHHTGKGRENDMPSKNNLLGSQAFEAKMRVVFELRNDLADDSKKHLCVVKGNYLPAEYKKESYVLNFSENLIFTNTGDRCLFDMLVKNEDVNKDRNEKIVEMRNQGYTYEQIAEMVGLKSRGSVAKILKSMDVSSKFPEETKETTNEQDDNILPF